MRPDAVMIRYETRLLLGLLFLTIALLSPVQLNADIGKNNAEQAAISRYSRYIEANINNGTDLSGAYFGRGLNHFLLHQHANAYADFSKGIAANAKVADNYLGRALVLHETGHYRRALENFNIVNRLSSQRLDACIGCAMANYSLGEYDQSIVWFNVALKMAPHNADCYVGRAAALQAKGNHRRALSDLDRAMALGYWDTGTYIASAGMRLAASPAR